MIVYVLTEEWNESRGGEPDLCVLGVYASEAGAEAARRQRVTEAQAAGQLVYGEVPEDAPDPDDWDRDYTIEAHELCD